MQKILLVEDSLECQMIVKAALKSSDVKLTAVSSVAEAEQVIAREKFQLVLLDLNLPDGSGLNVLAKIQAQDLPTPVVLITTQDEVESKVAAFNLGAEDYLIKPFHPLEFRARIEMRLQKTRQQSRTLGSVQRGPFIFNAPLAKASLQIGTALTPLDLTGKEYKILYFLANHEGSVYSRAQLVKEVWDEKVHVLDRTVDSHVCALRRKLQGHGDLIESVPGLGYRFNPKRHTEKNSS